MYHGSLPRLREQSQRFHEFIQELKRKTPLHPALKWYPWASLGQFDVLDELLQGDTAALLKMVGPEAVLDVGCGDGDIAFFFESLGLSVDAIDNAPTNYNAMYGVRALKDALKSPLNIQATDIDVSPRFPRPHYGFTNMLGVLYHLKNPYLVLESLARCSDHIYLSTRIAQLAPDRKTHYSGNPIAYLVDDQELNADDTNFWIFTEEGLKRIVRRAGWDILHYATTGPLATSDPVTPEGDCRAYIVARSRLSGMPRGFRLLQGWHKLEDTWRWTARTFSVEIETAALSSPTLTFEFHIPEPVRAQNPSITLRARANGQELPPATYNTLGVQTYTARLNAVPAGSMVVEFELDRCIGPSDADPRELGVLVQLTDAQPVKLA